MILTEAESCGKECLDPDGGKCLSSGCMAWRWVEINVCDAAWRAAVVRCAAEIGDTSPHKTKAAAKVAEDRAAWGLPVVPTRGYCGLAGIQHDLPSIIR